MALSVLGPTRPDRLVAVDFDDSDGLTVEVRAEVPLSAANGADALEVVAEAARVGVGDGDGLPMGAALAVLAELAPVLDAVTSERGMRLTLGWPAEPV